MPRLGNYVPLSATIERPARSNQKLQAYLSYFITHAFVSFFLAPSVLEFLERPRLLQLRFRRRGG
jgi:hypothetical protein